MSNLPTNFPFELGLYHKPEHVSLLAKSTCFSFVLFHSENDTPLALIHFSKTDCTTWQSPAQAPFGGLISHPTCNTEGIEYLFKIAESWLNIQACTTLIIKSPARIYEYNQNFSFNFYKTLGFLKESISTNYYIKVQYEDFTSIIKPQERRRIKKCTKYGFTCKILTHRDVVSLYGFIKKNRETKGYHMPVNFEKLDHLFQSFPENVVGFGVYNDQELVAASVCIKVTDKILYNFLVSDNLAYRGFSPVAKLYETIYDYCKNADIEVLDMGVSLDNDGAFKPSLARFKLNMGAKTGEKITWVKSLFKN